MYVAISVPKNMQSDARKAHISSLRLSRPVLVCGCSRTSGASIGGGTVAPASTMTGTAAWAISLRRLERPTVDAADQQQQPDDRKNRDGYGAHGVRDK